MDTAVPAASLIGQGKLSRSTSNIHAEEDRILFDGGQETDEKEEAAISLQDLSLRDWNLLFCLPFFSYVCIYQPFIFFVVQLETFYEIKPAYTGILMAAFHTARMTVIAGNVPAPKTSHVLGSLVGAVGFAVLVMYPYTPNVYLFAASTIATGFVESSAVVLVYSKDIYAANTAKMRIAMSYQSAAIGIAVIFGFALGGAASNSYGIRGNAVVGICMCGLNLISLAYFLIAPPNGGGNTAIDKTENEATPADTESGEDVFERKTERRGKFRQSSIIRSIVEGTSGSTMMTMYHESEEISSSHLTYLVALLFSFDSVVIGYMYCIGFLYISDNFGVSAGTASYVFSAGSLCGTVMTLCALSSKGRSFQEKYIKSPYNIYLCIITSTVSALGLLVPNFTVQSLCIILIHIAQELFLTLITELQGAITTSNCFATLGPVAQISRKALQVLFSLTGPILYSVAQWLPYMMTGILCVIYVFTFIFFAQKQQKENEKKIADLQGRVPEGDKKAEPPASFSMAAYRKKSFASRECLARMASVVVSTDAIN